MAASNPNNSAIACYGSPITTPTKEIDHGVRKQSNLPKILGMMTEGNNVISPNRKGSNSRDQRRQSNVFDAVDLTATLLAITQSTVDLNATTSIDDDVLKANIIQKGGKKSSVVKQMVAINELECNSEDSDDEKVPEIEEQNEQDKRSKIEDANISGKSMSTMFTSFGLEYGSSPVVGSATRKVSYLGSFTGAGNDQEASERKVSPLHYGTGWEASLMGFTIVAGGQLYGWNTGFSAGFGSYFIAQIVVGFAYVILLCCLGENTAALAFPGGSYGLARVCLGFYPGYLVACCEMMEYIFMSTTSVFYVGQMAVSCAKIDPSYAPVFWVLFYGFGIATTCSSLKVMWYTSTILCVIIFVLLFMYCIGSAKYTNLALYGPYWDNTAMYVPVMGNNNMAYSLDYTTTTVVTQANGMNVTMALGTPLMPTNSWDPTYWFAGGMSGWMSTLAVCTWGYAGIECLVLMTDMMKVPKKNIPIGCAGGISLLFVTNIATTIICAAMPPGLFTTVGNPTYMSIVYQLIFPRLSDAGAWLLILPGQIGMGWGFFAPVGKLLQALGQSNLLPRFLCLNDAESHKTGVVVGCVMGLMLCIVGHFKASFAAALQNIAISCACIQYFANLYSFISLKTTFKQVEREFKSPFGIVGSVVCMLIFMLVFISTLFFQSDGFMGTRQYTTLTAMGVIILLFSLWYFLFVTGAQCFSPSEQKTVFRMHVYQFNMKKNKTHEEVSTCDKCSAFAYLRSVYANAWNKFDRETKRISKNIDEKMDERYFRAWQYFMSFSPGDETCKTMKPLEGGCLSNKPSFSIHNIGRKSVDNSQIYVETPPPASGHTIDLDGQDTAAAGGGGGKSFGGNNSSQKDTSPLLKTGDQSTWHLASVK